MANSDQVIVKVDNSFLLHAGRLRLVEYKCPPGYMLTAKHRFYLPALDRLQQELVTDPQRPWITGVLKTPQGDIPFEVDYQMDQFRLQRQHVQQLRRFAAYIKSLYVSPQMQRPVLPPQAWQQVEDTVIKFWDAIKKLGDDYRGIGNRGLLLSGPPGTGKSLTLAWLREQARQRNKSHHTCSMSDLSHLLTEKKSAPNVQLLLVDDVDASLLQNRENSPTAALTSSLLSVLDGVDKHDGLVRIFSTNQPVDDIDEAILRPQRIDVQIKFELPSEELIDQYCRQYEVPIPSQRFYGWSFAKISRYQQQLRVDQVIDELSPEASLEKFETQFQDLDHQALMPV